MVQGRLTWVTAAFRDRYARAPKRSCSRQPGGLLWLIQDMLSEFDARLAVDQQLMVRLIAADCHGSPRTHNTVDRTRVVAKIAQFGLDPDDECPARPSGLVVTRTLLSVRHSWTPPKWLAKVKIALVGQHAG